MENTLTFKNYLSVYDQINEDLLSKFDDFFTTLENQYSYNTRSRKNNNKLAKQCITQQPTV